MTEKFRDFEILDAKTLLVDNLYYGLSTDIYAKNIIIEDVLLSVVRALGNQGILLVKEKADEEH